MERFPIEQDQFDVSMVCCVADGSWDSPRSLEYKVKDRNVAASSNKQPALKSRLSGIWGSKLIKAKLTSAKGSTSNGDKKNHQTINFNMSPRQSVAHQHFEHDTYPEDLGQTSLLDDDCDGPDDEEGGVADDGCMILTWSESRRSRCKSPAPEPEPEPEDTLAWEVGQNAHEYLEECFYTEAAVLSREMFDTIPQIDRADFTVMSHLGKGNFSDVFQVGCEDGQRLFAMKCLRPQIRSDEDQFTIGAEDLVHETAILANLNHRNIIKLHGRASGLLADAFLNGGYFILLDKLNQTLQGRFASWRVDELTLQEPKLEQLEVAYSIADAMAYLHSRKIVFRDLKPDNVGFDHKGEVKLFDFGFASGLPEKDESNPAGFLYDRCGTPRYMAPEVGFSIGYREKADVYSFGILLWEMCALDKPFVDIQSADEFEKLVFTGGLRPPITKRWPKHVKAAMRNCWRSTPSKRPSMSDVKSLFSMLISNISRSRLNLR